jgi:hypothetical protein
MNEPLDPDRPDGIPDQFAVSVIVSVPADGGGSPAVVGVVAGDRGGGESLIRSDSGGRQLLYPGFRLRLHKDETESYYMNLTGDHPSIFVVCSEDEDERLQPSLVTLSYDEVSSYMEVEDAVFSVPMPPELYRWIEAFVLQNYVPERRKKRKLDRWKEQTSR